MSKKNVAKRKNKAQIHSAQAQSALKQSALKQSSEAATARRPRQLRLLQRETSAYGGDLLKTRKGRARARPLATRDTMHLVLRSTKAKGDWSFSKPKNAKLIRRIIEKFSFVYGVRVISMANVGNHLHLQIKLSNRATYAPFIRAITGAIALGVAGRRRRDRNLERLAGSRDQNNIASFSGKFWDARPFTRIVQSFKAFLNLKDYIRINQFEGFGYRRDQARMMIDVEKSFG